MPPPLIFVGVADDRRTTFVDFEIGAGDPSARARGLLDEHRSSAQIEIWREEICIAVIARRSTDATA